ncbi:GNAT family N-acetyltransferase [Croceibacter atlanticus]|uniref:GNAT family N-acetyltransferase n=1 Tax=Croceibacter atlanticus TaxID=313588 RepID=UPI0030DD0D88|tara:strand:- start:83978 stop:85024 length:1047 start_codon:yes stop_codon:yes gene_type:complete
MNKYKIINISEESKFKFKECFDNNSSEKQINKIEWQFLNNPVQQQFVDIALDTETDKTAAIYAIFPVQFKVKDTILCGSQSLDTITDKDYRGQGLFIKLANSVYRKAQESNVKLVYGFPNGNSIYGFQKKLEWSVLDPVPFLIKPLKTKYFTKHLSLLNFIPNLSLSFSKFKISKAYKLEFKNEFPVVVNDIWNFFSKDIQVAVNRDKKYLDWRYISKPNENYKILHCFSAADEYLGFIVYTVKAKHGGKIGYIMEFIYDLNNPLAAKQLLAKAISEIKQQKADCILSWCLDHSPNYRIFKNSLFFKMPEKLRPIELHFGVRAFDPVDKELLYNRKNWYLSYSDSDTV